MDIEDKLGSGYASGYGYNIGSGNGAGFASGFGYKNKCGYGSGISEETREDSGYPEGYGYGTGCPASGYCLLSGIGRG